MTPVKVALGQINPTIGDFEGNRRLVQEATAAAERQGAELAVFSPSSPSPATRRATCSSVQDSWTRPLRRWPGLASSLASSRTAVVVGFPERLPPARPVEPSPTAPP
jgi:predicted amidohydrolase